ncbi:MAG: MchC protein [Proteobacteria bacterium]|nr:MchC protein [Pseudomonadota bacterium]
MFETYVQPTVENTAILGKELPASSFVAFDAFKLKQSELVWLNNDYIAEIAPDQDISEIEKQLLKNYTYVTRGYTQSSAIDLGKKKLFLADRYGSRHEACNGGSGRCGINGQFQVKGIGVNPLVADNIDRDHAHGKLCLSEAINEAIWGEICHRHLPYGAVRTVAIIKTNVTIRSAYGVGTETNQPCALAIRQNAIRPAHFERATFFWPTSLEHQYLREDDYLRVKAAVEQLHLAFDTRAMIAEGQHQPFNAFANFTIRLARQMGVSRVLGIPHGSLTSSNISIDGRFLDFGSISAVPDFANHILAAGQGGVWDDHLLVVEWIRHLFFFINKYHSQKLTREMQDGIIELFLAELERTENKETAKLMGISVNDASAEQIGKRIKQLLQQNKTPRPLVAFKRGDFVKDLCHAAAQVGLQSFDPKRVADLRDPKLSQYHIVHSIAGLVKKDGGQRSSISLLIADYLGKL